jgi:hypothetical protein
MKKRKTHQQLKEEEGGLCAGLGLFAGRCIRWLRTWLADVVANENLAYSERRKKIEERKEKPLAKTKLGKC